MIGLWIFYNTAHFVEHLLGLIHQCSFQTSADSTNVELVML